jgi:glycerophosphoryl diester phosphodiesterase
MRAAVHPFLATRFQAVAHRGGTLFGVPENTVAAFAQAVAMGYTYVETDLQVTADGVLVAFHDDTLERLTDSGGPIGARSFAELSDLRVEDLEPIPAFADLLEAFPSLVFNVDLKGDGSEELLPPLLERTCARGRVCVSSFSTRRLERFRRLAGTRVATALTPAELLRLLAFGPGTGQWLQGDVAQIPRRYRGLRLDTRRLLRSVHRSGGNVHVWTVNNVAAMEELIDAGVDGIVTDRIDDLKMVLQRRGLWEGT